MVPRQSDEEVDTEEENILRLDRRRHNNIKDWAVIVTLILNLSGLIWTAAKWSAAIDLLQTNDGKREAAQEGIGSRLNQLESRVNLLEFRVNNPQKEKQ